MQPAINRFCPRSGKPVSTAALARYRGFTVGFCNPGCRDDFVSRPHACLADRNWFDALLREQGLDRDQRLPTLQGERLCLRWLEESDLDAVHAVFSDPDTLRYWSHAPFVERAQSAAYLESIRRYFAQGDLWQWGVAHNGDGAVLGTVTLNQIDTTHKRAEIGFVIGRAHWQQGYATEALRLLLAHAFDSMGLQRIGADVDPRNIASLRTLARLGFVREGHARETWRVGGGVQDSVLLGLLARQWAAVGAQSPQAVPSEPTH